MSDLNLWSEKDLKETFVWIFTFALVTLFNVNKSKNEHDFLVSSIKGTIGASVFVIYVAELYAFPLLVEIFIYPVLVFFVIAKEFSKRDDCKILEYTSEFIIISFLVSAIVNSVTHVLENYENIDGFYILKDFCLPIILSILYLPFVYLFSVFLTYERIYVHLNLFGCDESIRPFVKREIFRRFGINADLLRRVEKALRREKIRTRAGAHAIFSDVQGIWSKERYPPKVCSSEGWSPFWANEYLTEVGLVPSDYYSLAGEFWSAETSLVDLSKPPFADNLAYYLDGDEDVVQRLKIVLNVNDLESASCSEEVFRSACLMLVEQAMGNVSKKIQHLIDSAEQFDVIEENRRIKMVSTDMAIEKYRGYTRKFMIYCCPEYQALGEGDVAG
ncbi:hypothetical protein [Aestuariispira ectoiniformans]|uniref:hypothetical protein n=1 Tax=Aestuariispira ectoiniformans TaxID=2775080 RepID=UPI00223AE105|nr:hypothetical protein [Aestuariispira ectoiniformans]